MAKIVIMGAGIGGCSAAYELRSVLGKAHEITVVNATDYFQSRAWTRSPAPRNFATHADL